QHTPRPLQGLHKHLQSYCRTYRGSCRACTAHTTATAGSTQAPAELLQDLQRILQSTYTPHRSYCRTYRGSCRACTAPTTATAGPTEDPAEHTTATARP